MKNIIALICFLLVSVGLSAQTGSQAVSGVKYRVNDTTSYQSSVSSAHTQGYSDIYFNNQAVRPHFDIWNGSSYTHIFNFGSGSGSGTVSSVGLSLPSIFSVSGSPVTTSGTLTGTLATQSANRIFAGPSSGSPATPTFRALVSGDIPTLGYWPVTGTKALTGAVTINGIDGTNTLDLIGSEFGSTTTYEQAGTYIQIGASDSNGGSITQYTSGGWTTNVTSTSDDSNNSSSFSNDTGIVFTSTKASTSAYSQLQVDRLVGTSITNSTTSQEFTQNNTGTKLKLGSDATGDIFYRNSSGYLARLGAGSNGQFMKIASGLPSYASITAADVTSGAALTKTDDTNVTLTLGGTPTTALLAATSLTLGWSGTLAYSRFVNGAGLSVVGRSTNSSGVQADIAGTANQVLRVNSGGTALAFGAIDISTGSVTGTLPVGNGGTGATAFTLGSVVFAGTSGVYTQDNSNFFWDDTNNRLNVGTATSISRLTVQTDALNTTQTTTSGITLNNSTAATVSQNQISPFLRFSSAGWKTNATAASQVVDWYVDASTSTGAANPNGTLRFAVATNGGATANVATLTNGGTFSLTSLSSISSVTALSIIPTATTTNGVNLQESGNVNVTHRGVFYTAPVIFNAGTLTFSGYVMQPTYNETAGTNHVNRGFVYDPIETAIIGTHYAYLNTSTTAKSGLGTATPTEMLEVVGNVKPNHIIGRTSAPSIAAGVGAGTGPTVVVTNATDLSGIVDVTTGTSPTAASTIATITFNTAYGVAPNVSITCNNANAAGVITTTSVTSTTTTFVITGTLSASTQYKWFYHIIQ